MMNFQDVKKDDGTPLNSEHGIEQSNIGREKGRTMGLVAHLVGPPIP
jgi:hypothetical protein